VTRSIRRRGMGGANRGANPNSSPSASGSRRYDEHAPAGAEYRHANRPAGCLEDETAFRAPPQAQIKLDPSVDVAATQRAPGTFRVGHYAERGGRCTILGAHRYGERADPDECCLKRYRPQVGTVNPQQRDIGRGIASDELCRHRVTAGKCDGELASDKASSAVTTSPGRQTKPLERER
jgi:hypothetical protein